MSWSVLNMKCKCLCMALRWVYSCVFICRCIHLKELTLSECEISDAGISMVIRKCSQLYVLNLWGLPQITGMFALFEDSETTLCFITLWCIIILQKVNHKGPPLDHIVRRRNSFRIIITFSLILHCIICCSQIHHNIFIHIFEDLDSDMSCLL